MLIQLKKGVKSIIQSEKIRNQINNYKETIGKWFKMTQLQYKI